MISFEGKAALHKKVDNILLAIKINGKETIKNVSAFQFKTFLWT